jgi:type IV secretion system protein VirB5
VHFERGSREAIEAARWRTSFLLVAIIAVAEGGAIWAMLPLKSVETVAVGKDQNNRIQVAGIAGQVTIDDESKMAWASDWVAELTEINPVTWERNVNRAIGKTAGIASDQAATYLRKRGNNPAVLLHQDKSYVREYERGTVNKVSNDVFLVRYQLTSRPRPGATPEVKAYAMTLTLAPIKHSSREDVFRNPAALVVTTFSLAEES